MKEYIKVIAVFYPDGTIVPRVILRDNAPPLEINYVCDIRRAVSLSAGGYGVRYTCISCGQQMNLYFEDSRWFVDDTFYLR